MAIGSGIILIAIGAILTYAVEATVSGVNLDVVGVILMVAGAAGVLISLVLAGSHTDHAVRTDVYEERRVS